MDGITKREYNKLMVDIAIIKQATSQAALIEDLVNEQEAARLLGRSVLTIQTWVYKGSLSKDAYTVGAGGVRFYKKSHLLGLKTA